MQQATEQSSYEVYLVINIELNSYVAKTESSGKRNAFLANTMNHAHKNQENQWLTKSVIFQKVLWTFLFN